MGDRRRIIGIVDALRRIAPHVLYLAAQIVAQVGNHGLLLLESAVIGSNGDTHKLVLSYITDCLPYLL